MTNPRRTWLKSVSTAGVALPLFLLARSGIAAKNDAMRTSLKYQEKPEGTKSCSNCLQFVPGKTAKDKGGCKILPGDTEISPSAYCIAWVEAKK